MCSSSASLPSLAAAARAAIWGVASVPERRPFSCPPPRRRGMARRPLRINKAPEPFIAPILCPLMVTRSAPKPLGVKGIFKNPCTASVCSRALDLCRLSTCAASATGWMAPVSLFTSSMDTSTVSGRRASSRASMRICPVASGCR